MKYLYLIAMAVFSSAVYATGDSFEQIDPVIRTADGAAMGESVLQRSANRVQAVVRTSDLDPGSAVTVWWRIYNRPQHCAIPFACEAGDLGNPKVRGSQLHATALVVGESDGTATLVASLYRTAFWAQGGIKMDESFVEPHLNGRGLRRPLNAEIELLLASHGRVADADSDGEQAALDQLLTPGGTKLDCMEADKVAPGRTYRCGVIQKIDHSGGY